MFVRKAILLPRNIAILLLKIYRRIISPLYGQVCKYYPSCSRYALEAYQKHAFVKATALTAWRLMRCNPWSLGGVDDVAPAEKNTTKITNSGFVTPLGREA